MNVEEWEEFQPTGILSPELSAKLWDSVNKNTTSPAARSSWFRWLAVAASLLLVIGLSWYYLFNHPKTIAIDTAAVATKNISNNTPQKTALSLSDGSIIELSPHSSLSYPGNFNALKRDVILINGEANFNIARNVAKPFSVYSNSVLITVLGTRFTVSADEANNTTKVILYEGRIMVKIADSSSRVNKNEYYLSPGDIFILKKIIASDSLSARVLHLEKDKEDRYVFNNHPLDIVFDQLQIIYNTKIKYDKAELGNRTFIGKIDKKDSLYHILQSIALLNHFSLHKQGDSFIISN